MGSFPTLWPHCLVCLYFTEFSAPAAVSSFIQNLCFQENGFDRARLPLCTPKQLYCKEFTPSNRTSPLACGWYSTCGQWTVIVFSSIPSNFLQFPLSSTTPTIQILEVGWKALPMYWGVVWILALKVLHPREPLSPKQTGTVGILYGARQSSLLYWILFTYRKVQTPASSMTSHKTYSIVQPHSK